METYRIKAELAAYIDAIWPASCEAAEYISAMGLMYRQGEGGAWISLREDGYTVDDGLVRVIHHLMIAKATSESIEVYPKLDFLIGACFSLTVDEMPVAEAIAFADVIYDLAAHVRVSLRYIRRDARITGGLGKLTGHNPVSGFINKTLEGLNYKEDAKWVRSICENDNWPYHAYVPMTLCSTFDRTGPGRATFRGGPMAAMADIAAVLDHPQIADRFAALD